MKTHLLLPRTPLQYHGYGSHQMGDASNSDSSREQLPHMNQCLFPRAAASPPCLSSGQEAAAGNLQYSHLRVHIHR